MHACIVSHQQKSCSPSGLLHCTAIITHELFMLTRRTCFLTPLQGSISRCYPHTHRWLPEQHHSSDQHRTHRL